MSEDDDTNPYAPPAAQDEPPPPPRATGALELRIGKKVPPVCLKCGRTGELVHRTHNFVWVPPAKLRNQVAWGMLLGPIGGAIAASSNAKHQKTAQLEIPLCWACNVRWTNGRLMAGGSVASIFLVFLFAALIGVRGNGPLVLVLMFASLASMFLAVRAVAKRTLQAVHIDDETVLVGNVAPLAIERVEEIRARAPKKKKKRKPVEPDADE